MGRAHHKGLYCGVAAALMSAAAASASAQQAPSPQAARLEEVVVTATRVETNLQKTAVAATAMSARTLTEHNVSTLLDVSSYVPDLSIGSKSGAGLAEGVVAIRGMGVDATGSSAAVGIYVDDVYLPSGAGNLLGLFDVSRVEVLRGPQGSLFGRNTIAGAIQYVTNPPDSHFGGYLDATAGTESRYDVQGALNLPITDNFAVRIAGASNSIGGYVHDLTADVDRGADRTHDIRIKARWTPTGRLAIDLKGEHVDEQTNGRPVVVSGVNPNAEFVGLAELFGETHPLNSGDISPGKYTAVGINAPDYLHFSYDEVQAALKYTLTSDIDIKSISAYSVSRSALAQDFDNTPLSILQGVNDDNIRLFTQELQVIRQNPSDKFRWTLGAYFYDSEDRQIQSIQLGLGPTQYPYGLPKTDVTSVAVYGQATYQITDQFSATAGLRYSREHDSAGFVATPSPATATFSNASPYIGLDFNLNKDVLIYVKASEGFRAGGITQSLALPGDGLAFAQETAWTYEAGARLQFLDHRLRINPTVFFTTWDNIQFNTLVPTSTTVVAATENAGNAQIKGFELESQFAVTDRLTLTGSLSLLNSRYTHVKGLTYSTYPYGFLASLPNPETGQVTRGTTVILPNISLDSPLQRAPRTKFSVGGRYAYPLPREAQLVASLDYTWTDKQSSAVTISDSVELPSYGLLNGRLQYDAPDHRWSVAVFGTNLTDQFYLVGGVDFAKGYTAGTTELDVARPREIGVEIRRKF